MDLNKTIVQSDIVKLAIYYFSHLPVVKNKSKCNKRCSEAYGVILLLVASMTVSI